MEKLILRLNPIGSEGAASIFSALEQLPITNLDMAGCSLDETITKLFMQLVVQNKTLLFVDLSNNWLEEVRIFKDFKNFNFTRCNFLLIFHCRSLVNICTKLLVSIRL